MARKLSTILGVAHLRGYRFRDFYTLLHPIAIFPIFVFGLAFAYAWKTGEDILFLYLALTAVYSLAIVWNMLLFVFPSGRHRMHLGLIIPNPLTIWFWPILAWSKGGCLAMYLQWMRPNTLYNRLTDYFREDENQRKSEIS